MSFVFADIEKARKEIYDATGVKPNYMDASLQIFNEMGIDAKKDGKHLGGDLYRVKINE